MKLINCDYNVGDFEVYDKMIYCDYSMDILEFIISFFREFIIPVNIKCTVVYLVINLANSPWQNIFSKNLLNLRIA